MCKAGRGKITLSHYTHPKKKHTLGSGVNKAGVVVMATVDALSADREDSFFMLYVMNPEHVVGSQRLAVVILVIVVVVEVRGNS